MVHKRLAKKHEDGVKEQEQKIADLEKQLKALELEQKATPRKIVWSNKTSFRCMIGMLF